MKFGYAEQGVMKGIIRDFAMGNADIWDLIERIKLNFGYRFDNDMSMGYRFVKNNGTALLIGHAMSRDPQYHFLYRLNAFVERQKKMTVPMDDGGHSIRVRAVGPAGVESDQTDSALDSGSPAGMTAVAGR